MLAEPLVSIFVKALANMLLKLLVNIFIRTGDHVGQTTLEHVSQVTGEHVGRVTDEYIDRVTGHYIGQLNSLHIGRVTGELAGWATGEHIDQVTGRLEQSDFFSRWMGGKMKIRLEKPAANISKLAGGKNEKARREALHEKLRADLYLVYRKHWLEIKITEYVICRQEAF